MIKTKKLNLIFFIFVIAITVFELIQTYVLTLTIAHLFKMPDYIIAKLINIIIVRILAVVTTWLLSNMIKESFNIKESPAADFATKAVLFFASNLIIRTLIGFVTRGLISSLVL